MWRKIISVALAVFVSLAPFVPASAALTWSNPYYIHHLEPAGGGWVWIRLASTPGAPISLACPDGGSTSGNIILAVKQGYVKDQFEFNMIYSTLLSAAHAGKKVRFRLSTDESNFCRVERVLVTC